MRHPALLIIMVFAGAGGCNSGSGGNAGSDGADVDGQVGDAGTLPDGTADTDGGDAGPPPDENSGDILCRHTDCVALDPSDPEDASALALGYRFRVEGRVGGPNGQCGPLAVSFFVAEEACEQIRYLALPSAHFYGNRGTWGSLGLDDNGQMWPDVDAVVARFNELCQGARADSGLGDRLRCGADLIGYAPTGYLPVTQQVAERLIQDYNARITIDIRTSTSFSFGDIQSIVENIFSGNSSIIDNTLLDAHPIGLSLDYEPQIVGGGYTSVPASVANAACGAHRNLMTARGHDPDELWCFLYEFGRPTMMADGDNLDPWVFPVLMTATMGQTGDGDTPQEVQEALELKESWVDYVAAEYANTDVTGCMFFVAPYLYTSQRDQFTFVQAIEAFGDKCSVYSFQ